MKTPCYVIVSSQLRQNLSCMQERMAPSEIFYSMKSNPDEKVAKVLAATGCGFEIASLAEAKTLERLGIAPRQIYCGLPVMADALLVQIAALGCGWFVYDTARELERIKRLAPQASRVLRLKINDLSPDAIGYGITTVELVANPQFLQDAEGLSFHISDHSDISQTLAALDRVESLLLSAPHIHLVNIGGSYTLSGQEQDYASLRRRLQQMMARFQVRLMCELGSAIINTAASVLTRCILVHEQDGFTDLFLDGGIPSGIMRRPRQLINLTRSENGPRHVYRFFDTTSMRRLLFQMQLRLTIREGDLLRLTDYGAYSLCYSNNFHSQPMPETRLISEESEFEQLV